MKNKYIVMAVLTILGFFSGCSDEFLERPPQDTLVDANFYKTDDQVLASTAGLYSAVWKDYIDKANFKLGDFRGGTAFVPGETATMCCSTQPRFRPTTLKHTGLSM